jgi:excisionase family DNA binding protein
MTTEQNDSPRTNEGAAPACPGCSPVRLAHPEPPMTVDELADFLRVERKTLYDAIARGELPGVRRIGRLIRISRVAVLAWLAEGQGRVSRSRGKTL